MLRVIISSLLIVNSLFWGLYPHCDDCKIAVLAGVKKCPSKYLHLSIGLLFIYSRCFSSSTNIYSTFMVLI